MKRISIEQTFAKAGPYATTTDARTVTNASGRKVIYKLYYPKNYNSLGFKSPILTWGNGSNGTPGMYSTLLGHLASYGFTIVAPDLKDTGSGRDIGEAARYMVEQNSVAGPFSGNLDVRHVGALGHSQGAGGAAAAALQNPKVITTVITFSLPDKKWASANSDCPTAKDCSPEVSMLKQSVFFISTRGWWDSQFGIAPPATEQAYFHSVRAHAALGIITSTEGQPADHNSIQNAANGGHPGGELGYATAWLKYQLLGNAAAGTAFTGARSEIATNPNWSGSAVK